MLFLSKILTDCCLSPIEKLIVILMADSRDMIAPIQLSKALHLSSPTVHHSLKRLQNMNVVKRHKNRYELSDPNEWRLFGKR